jgi:Tfp pilus assembly protein PilX
MKIIRPIEKKRLKDLSGRKGAVMVIILMVTMLTLLIGLAGMVLTSTDLKLSWNYKRSTMAFFAAESGVQRAIAELREDNSWTDGFTTTAQGNGSNYQVTVSQISSQLDKIRSIGTSSASRRVIEVVVNVDSVFDHALNIGGDLVLSGKPRISSEGIRINGNAYLDLDNGTPTVNLYAPTTATITFADGSDTTPLVRSDSPAMDLNAAKLSDQDWNALASNAASSVYYDTDGISGDKDTSVTINNLDFDSITAGEDGKKTIYVDGNVTLNGSISGIGTIVASGNIIGTGNFVTSGTPTVSFISRGDVLLNFDTNAQSQMNGLTYAEGAYEMHGKIKYTGVVTAFGGAIIQNPSEFTNNNDPNYWYTYSAAYSIVSDPVDIILWQEVMQ